MPSLGGATGWLNSEPLGPAELQGQVVLFNFWTLTCINWLRQEPYLRAWSKPYRDDGLIVIGVHTPEFSFEHEIDGVRRATEERAIDYPVADDYGYEDLERLRQPLLPELSPRPTRATSGRSRAVTAPTSSTSISRDHFVPERGDIGATRAKRSLRSFAISTRRCSVSRWLILRPPSSLPPPRKSPNSPPDAPGLRVLGWRLVQPSPSADNLFRLRHLAGVARDLAVARNPQAQGAAYAPLFAEPLDRSIPLHGSEETQ